MLDGGVGGVGDAGLSHADWLRVCRATLVAGRDRVGRGSESDGLKPPRVVPLRSDLEAADGVVDGVVEAPSLGSGGGVDSASVELLEQALVHGHDTADLRERLVRSESRIEHLEEALARTRSALAALAGSPVDEHPVWGRGYQDEGGP